MDYHYRRHRRVTSRDSLYFLDHHVKPVARLSVRATRFTLRRDSLLDFITYASKGDPVETMQFSFSLAIYIIFHFVQLLAI